MTRLAAFTTEPPQSFHAQHGVVGETVDLDGDPLLIRAEPTVYATRIVCVRCQKKYAESDQPSGAAPFCRACRRPPETSAMEGAQVGARNRAGDSRDRLVCQIDARGDLVAPALELRRTVHVRCTDASGRWREHGADDTCDLCRPHLGDAAPVMRWRFWSACREFLTTGRFSDNVALEPAARVDAETLREQVAILKRINAPADLVEIAERVLAETVAKEGTAR